MGYPTIKYDDEKHKYWIGGEEVPSVTQILGEVTDKSGALTWWGMRVGFAAVIRLLQTDKLSAMSMLSYDYDDHLSGKPVRGEAIRRGKKDKTPLEALAIANRLTTNHVRDTKADLGTLIHAALEEIGITEKFPDLSEFEPEAQPYMRAFASFWLDQDPFIEQQEVIVGSAEHRYAGRFDLSARIDEETYLLDYKTSKGVYRSHSEQLVLYELAWREMGNEPHDNLAVVHLRDDGTYAMKPAWTSDETAIAAVNLYHARAADSEPKGWSK